MVGDARRLGGAYSDNPATMRTRAYNAALEESNPEKSKARKQRFSEYRSLRSACLRVEKSSEYKKELTRDGKINLLRVACHNTIAQRASSNKEVMGVDIEMHIAKFHDFHWEKNRKAINNKATGPAQHSPAAGQLNSGNFNDDLDEDEPASPIASSSGLPMADRGSVDTAGPGSSHAPSEDGKSSDVEFLLSAHDENIASLNAQRLEMTAQVNSLTMQVMHLTEVATVHQTRMNEVVAKLEKQTTIMDGMMKKMAQFNTR